MLNQLNAFLEDTCVLVAVAYLLTRGPFLQWLQPPTHTRIHEARLGIFFLSVITILDLLPDARYPYAPLSLLLTFAAWHTGARVAFITGLGSLLLAALTKQSLPAALGTVASLPCIFLAMAFQPHRSAISAFALGALSQVGFLGVSLGLSQLTHNRLDMGHLLLSIPANGIGMVLLRKITEEAQLRTAAEHHRLQAEQAVAETEMARSMIAETKLAVLRARLNPHFLYNTLTSIAALCSTDATRAESATIWLGSLMRYTLEADNKVPTTLGRELESLQAYSEIEALRLGSRLQIHWELDANTLNCPLPPLILLTLLENAVQYAVAQQLGTHHIRVFARRRKNHVLLGVQDDGPGIAPERRAEILKESARAEDRVHGLQLVTRQLQLLYGPTSRLRYFSQTEKGTTFFFTIPQRTLSPSETSS